MQLTEKQERHLERKKQKSNLTEIKAEEVKMESKKIAQMDNEDWEDSEDEKIEID
jgi:hypothetical protein